MLYRARYPWPRAQPARDTVVRRRLLEYERKEGGGEREPHRRTVSSGPGPRLTARWSPSQPGLPCHQLSHLQSLLLLLLTTFIGIFGILIIPLMIGAGGYPVAAEPKLKTERLRTIWKLTETKINVSQLIISLPEPHLEPRAERSSCTGAGSPGQSPCQAVRSLLPRPPPPPQPRRARRAESARGAQSPPP